MALEAEIADKLDEGETIVDNNGNIMRKFTWCSRFCTLYTAHAWDCKKPPCAVLGQAWEERCRPCMDME